MALLAISAPNRRKLRLAGAIALSVGMSILVMVSSWVTDTRLGAPLYWAWVLTGLQVLALWAAGRRCWWAWLLGAGVQPVWIVYAVLTGQLGFVLGCVVSAAVQVRNFFADHDSQSRRARVVSSDHVTVRESAHSSRCLSRVLVPTSGPMTAYPRIGREPTCDARSYPPWPQTCWPSNQPPGAERHDRVRRCTPFELPR
jgi:hypothetical protein